MTDYKIQSCNSVYIIDNKLVRPRWPYVMRPSARVIVIR